MLIHMQKIKGKKLQYQSTTLIDYYDHCDYFILYLFNFFFLYFFAKIYGVIIDHTIRLTVTKSRF